MVRSLKSQPSRTFESSRFAVANTSRGGQDDASVASSPAAEKTPWEMRLSLGQLGIIWSVVGGTMVMVFLFGLYAGREQGVKSALEGQQGEAVRLPVASPVAVQEIPAQIGADAVATGPVELAALPKEPPPAVTTGRLSGSIASDSLLAEPPTRESSGAADAAPSEGVATTLADKENAKREKERAAAAKEASAKEAAAKEAAAKDTAEKEAVKEKERAKRAEAELAKAEGVKTVKGALTPGWYLQVSAARNSGEASAVAKKLKSAGLKPVIETAQVNKSTYYRVVLGPYPNKDAATSARRAAISSNAAKGEPFLKQVK